MEKIAYSIPSAAAEVEVAVNRIREAIDNNDLVVRYVTPRNPRVARTELLRWFNALPTEPPSTA